MAVILAVAASQARGDMIMYTNPAFSGSLPQFNPALGTLRSAAFSDTYLPIGTTTITNTTTDPLSWSDVYNVHYAVTATLPGYGPWGVVQGVYQVRNGGVVQAGQTQTFTEGVFSQGETGAIFPIVDRISLAPFLGTGSIDYSTETGLTGRNRIFPPGLRVDGSSGTASGGVNITYTYDPAPAAVPEPSTLILVGTGLAVALVYRWRTQ
jgi:hypothetical protein